VIARLEYSDKGDNPLYVVANLEGEAQALYDQLYCGRGEMENRIKEAQLGAVRRSHQLPLLRRQPVPAHALRLGLHPDGAAAPWRLKGTEAARHQTQMIRL
jgi:hypothetical protein